MGENGVITPIDILGGTHLVHIFVGGNYVSIIIIICVVVPNIFYFHPYLGKIFHLTNIFQKGLKPPTSIILYTVRILTPPMETQTTLRSWQPWAQPVIILMQLLHDEYAFYHATMPPTQDAGINLGKTHQVLTWTSHKIPWDDCIFAYTWMVDWFLWVFHVGEKKNIYIYIIHASYGHY